MIKKINNFEVKSSGSISSGPAHRSCVLGEEGGVCISCCLAAEHGNVGVLYVGFKIQHGMMKIS